MKWIFDILFEVQKLHQRISVKKSKEKQKKHLTQRLISDNLIESLKIEAAKHIDNRITQSQRNSRENKKAERL